MATGKVFGVAFFIEHDKVVVIGCAVVVVTQTALILICQHQSHWIFVFIGRYYIGTKLGSFGGLGISGFL